MEDNEKGKNELEKSESLNEIQQLQNNKSRDKSNLIIIILLLVIAGLLVFIVYDKVFKTDTESKNNKEDNKQQEEIKNDNENNDSKDDNENKDDDSQNEEKPKDGIYNLPDGKIPESNEDLKKYHAIFKATNSIEQSLLNRLSKGLIEKLSKEGVEERKISFVITKIKPVKRSCSLIYLNPNDQFYCGTILEKWNKKEESTNEVNTITKKEVDSKSKEIFGEVLDVPKDNIVGYSESSVYIYDTKSNLFARHSFEGGGISPNVFEEKITSANKKGDLLTIESRQSISWGEMSTEAPQINKVILTLKWNNEVGRYVFYSRESYEQK